MRFDKPLGLIVGIVLLLAASPALAAGSDASAARVFTQSFYDHYLQLARSAHSGAAWDAEVTSKSSEFDPQLAQALKGDTAAQASVVNEIVSLDFDPFLTGQDPADHYDVDTPIQKGNTYWAAIHAVRGGHPSASVEVIAELHNQKGVWSFVNFHYPDGDDLLSLLGRLKKERETPAN